MESRTETARVGAQSEVWLASGVLAAEAELCAFVARDADAVRRDPRLLGRPLRIVVPSRSLREHLSALLVRGLAVHGDGGRAAPEPRALLGVQVETLGALAREVAGDAPGRYAGDLIFPSVVCGIARREPALATCLDALDDGYRIAVGTVADLLDAGLEPAHAPAMQEAISQLGSGEVAGRAGALVRIAVQARERLDALGAVRDADLFGHAADRLRAEPDVVVARGIVIYGVAEATGRLADWIEALMQCCGASIVIERPPDPFVGDRERVAGSGDASAVVEAFTRRLLERAQGVAPVRPRGTAPPPPRVRLVEAPGLEAEVRAVAERVRAHLDAGVAAERIGVVCRRLDGHALTLRRQFGRQGIPFSGVGGVGPADAVGRKLAALATVLERGGAVSIDRWLDAHGFDAELGSSGDVEPRRSSARSDLAVVLHAVGAGRLRDVAALDVEARIGPRKRVPLPVAARLEVDEDEPEDDDRGRERASRVLRRSVPRRWLDVAVRRARTLCEALQHFEDDVAGGGLRARDSLARVREIAVGALRWGRGVAALERLDAVLGRLATALPPGLVLSLPDLRAALRRDLHAAAATPIGGRGGGVQVLDVTEARQRSFDALFVLGLVRDGFPRSIREDALLPDAVRVRLLALLPDLPVKRSGHHEEEHLFAQLLSASADVTLSWASVDDDGRPKATSSFVDRYRLARAEVPVESVPSLWSPGWLLRPRQSVFERAVLAALHRPEALAPAFAKAIEATPHGETSAGPLFAGPALAAVRIAALCERDRTEGGAGPFDGQVGPPVSGDLRRGPISITALEGMARCPWQVFLRRLLALEPVPDALDAFASFDPRRVGNATHYAIENICRRAAPDASRDLEHARDAEPTPIPWPERAVLDAAISAAARETLLDDGVAIAGLEAGLARRIAERVEAAARLVWSEGGRLDFLGVEIEGSLEVAPGLAPATGPTPRTVRFRVDLVDRDARGLRLIDLKTGKCFFDAKTPGTRASKLAAAIGKGQSLQAAAYALGADARGGYVFLEPDPSVPVEQRTAFVSPSDRELAELFFSSARLLVAAWDAGVFFPRMVDARGGDAKACRFCEVASACHRGDASASARLLSAVAHEPTLRAVFRLADGAGADDARAAGDVGRDA